MMTHTRRFRPRFGTSRAAGGVPEVIDTNESRPQAVSDNIAHAVEPYGVGGGAARRSAAVTASVQKRHPRERESMTSLKVTAAFRAFVLDQLEELGEVTPRSMFGGVGLYCRGLFFGIIARDVLYLKVDDVTRGEYERAGMQPFKPYPKRSGTMQYYAVPLDVLESAVDLVTWAQKAVGAASRAADPSRRAARARFSNS